jgi:hypothetical protein
MIRVCSTNGGGVRTWFWWEDQKEKWPLAKPKRRWKVNIKMDLREIKWGGMDWLHLAKIRDQWRALVNMEIPRNFRVPQKLGNSSVAERLAASQRGLGSMLLVS